MRMSECAQGQGHKKISAKAQGHSSSSWVLIQKPIFNEIEFIQ